MPKWEVLLRERLNWIAKSRFNKRLARWKTRFSGQSCPEPFSKRRRMNHEGTQMNRNPGLERGRKNRKAARRGGVTNGSESMRMSKSIKMGVGFVACLFAAAWACVFVGCSEKKEGGSGTAEKPKEEESRVQHNTNGETIVKLDADTQKLMGLQTTALEAAELNKEVKAFGRVLDSATLASSVADLITAQ